ncbi:unnamed protein product [Symbiodinium microadriaticum]|nr:unnamed protein product [Symbiodinium microadriaticum]
MPAKPGRVTEPSCWQKEPSSREAKARRDANLSSPKAQPPSPTTRMSTASLRAQRMPTRQPLTRWPSLPTRRLTPWRWPWRSF